MCDCPQERDDKTVGRTTGPQTTTILSKCRAQYRPGRDALRLAVSAGNVDCITTDSTRSSNPRDSTRDSARISSASTESSSSGSGRTYKFVRCPAEFSYPGGEAGEASSPVSAVCAKTERIAITKTTGKKLDLECTLAIIKPEAVVRRVEIERRIQAEGFQVCQTRWLQLTSEQAAEFYDDRSGELYFPHLVMYMSSKPILALVLARIDAVEEWKRIIGPTTVADARLYFPDSIRARYGRGGDSLRNAVHGSDSLEQAEREIHFFFPEFITEPLLREETAEDFLWEVINPVLVKGLTLCCKTRPVDPVLWLAHWLILNNPNKPKLPEDLALIPT